MQSITIFRRCLLILVIVPAYMFTQQYVAVSTKATDKELLEMALKVKPSDRQLAWQKMEYYAFIHFGPNTFLGKEWGDGTADPQVFNPSELNADQWVKIIKNAGMKGLILTAKHHDGFCLWPTGTTDYSVEQSPWRNGKGDLVREVADACRREGIKMGIYLSPWDRNHPTYGDSPAYNKVFISQLTELLTNYGEIFEVWFDGANGEGPNGKVQQYDWNSYYSLVRRLQPKAVIAIMGPDVRWVGNEAGKGRDPEWSVLPIGVASQKVIAGDSQQEVTNGMFIPKNAKGDDLGSRHLLRGTNALIWYPSEVDTSIRPGWFYHPEQDGKVKTPDELENIYYNSVGMNSSLLLNIPPDKRGLIHENDIKSLMKLKEHLDKTFSANLADKIKYSGSKTKCTAIEFRMKCTVPFDRLLLQENIKNGQRVENFVLEIYKNGQWLQIATGKTVGYKRILRFPPTQAQRVRVRFTSYRAVPEILNAGIYLSHRN